MWKGDLGQEKEDKKNTGFSHWGTIREYKSSKFGYVYIRGGL